MICAGVDAGSRTLKIVLLDADRREPLASAVVDQGVDQDRLAGDLLARLLKEKGLRRSDLRAVVGTGYGRKLLAAVDSTVTEITCQARGIRHCLPDARSIIDIGGQDSKLVRLKENGAVADFAMNDRCAAGTGRFLEMLSAQLGTRLGEFGPLVRRSRSPAAISNMCVVFAESEIVGLLASGVEPADILAGVEAALHLGHAAHEQVVHLLMRAREQVARVFHQAFLEREMRHRVVDHLGDGYALINGVSLLGITWSVGQTGDAAMDAEIGRIMP